VLEAVAVPASPVGADGSGASPGVGLDFGTTSAPTTTAPGGLVDLDSLDGLEPTPLGAYASSGILPAEALSPGGAPGGLEPDDSPAPSGPPPPAGGSDRGTQTYEDHFIRSFVAGMSVPRLAAVIRALSPEDAANLRAALVEADATPDQDTAAVRGSVDYLLVGAFGILGVWGGPAHDRSGPVCAGGARILGGARPCSRQGPAAAGRRPSAPGGGLGRAHVLPGRVRLRLRGASGGIGFAHSGGGKAQDGG